MGCHREWGRQIRRGVRVWACGVLRWVLRAWRPAVAVRDDHAMRIWPRPGISGVQLLSAIRSVREMGDNVFGQLGGEAERLQQYLKWADEAGRMLRSSMRDEDFVRLVRTPAFWALVQSRGAVDGALGLVRREMSERVAELRDAADSLNAMVSRWAPASDLVRVVVADTNVYLHHQSTIDQIPWRSILSADDTDTVRLVVPMAVVDELDANKREDLRPRARTTTRFLWERSGRTLKCGARSSVQPTAGRES
jgi:hypothetical protein